MSFLPRVPLQQVATIEREIVSPDAIKNGTQYVGLENIESGGRLVDVRAVEAGELASSKFTFSPKHVLYGKLRPYLAKIARPNFAGVCSTDILPILPGRGLDRDYLALVLLAPDMVALANSRCTGANLPRLSPRALGEFGIPFPPLSEQRRIAEILNKADSLRAKRRAALATVDTLASSLFLTMFGDPITNPKGWPTKCISEVAAVITGNTPSRSVAAYYGSEIEWIKSDNINTPDYYVTRADECLSALGKTVARTAPQGSILVTCIAGSRAAIGNAAMTDREVAFNQQINALVPQDGDAHFIYAHLLVGKRLVQDAATSGMTGMVSKSRFELIKLMWPPVPLQERFGAGFRAIALHTALHRDSLNHLDSLFSSLQHRAFRGEL
jgi:type I restriction enzyme S subunit